MGQSVYVVRKSIYDNMNLTQILFRKAEKIINALHEYHKILNDNVLLTAKQKNNKKLLKQLKQCAIWGKSNYTKEEKK